MGSSNRAKSRPRFVFALLIGASEGLLERLALSSSARHFHLREKNTTAKMNSTKSALANRTGRMFFAYHLNSSTQHSNEQRVLSYCTSLLDNDSKE